MVVKPKLLMNVNGRCVGSLYKKYKIASPTDVILVHDDLDRALGKMGIKCVRAVRRCALRHVVGRFEAAVLGMASHAVAMRLGGVSCVGSAPP